TPGCSTSSAPETRFLSMDEERIKQAVLSVIERTDFAQKVATAVGALGSTTERGAEPAQAGAQTGAQTKGTQKLLTRIVLGDILDDTILGARPSDRTFPLRLLFSELGTLLAHEGEEGPQAAAAEQAFTLASGLNFFFRAEMDPEARVRVGLEV